MLHLWWIPLHAELLNKGKEVKRSHDVGSKLVGNFSGENKAVAKASAKKVTYSASNKHDNGKCVKTWNVVIVPLPISYGTVYQEEDLRLWLWKWKIRMTMEIMLQVCFLLK